MCPKTDIDPTKASALNVVNIGGVFVVSLTKYIIINIKSERDVNFCLSTPKKLGKSAKIAMKNVDKMSG